MLILAGVGVVSMAQALSDGHLLLCLYGVRRVPSLNTQLASSRLPITACAPFPFSRRLIRLLSVHIPLLQL